MTEAATPPAATDENATRGRHFQIVRTSDVFYWSTGTAVALAIFVGAVKGGVVAAAVAGAVVAAAAYAIAFAIADSRAKKDFWSTMARMLGLTFRGSVHLPRETPLLAAGDRRHCPEWMTGALPDGRELAVGNYTFEERHDNGDKPDTYTPYNYRAVLIQTGGMFVDGLYLRSNNWARFFGDHTLPGVSKELVKTESTAFDDRYDLYRASDADEGRVLEIVTPTFIDYYTGVGPDLGFDYHQGCLLVFARDHASDVDALTGILNEAKTLLTRIDQEVAEAAGPTA